ncbi:MAG: transcription antitermination factor NusB [Eubacterium sp.]|nr:transcription antitermination factor NusB [Eubacterium sp.]MBR1675004.1 transcription antitermination factor NusB [Eubacterium sp.]
MTRSELRENIFKIVFRAPFHDTEEMGEQEQEYISDLDEAEKDSDIDYIKAKSAAVIEKLEEIDKLIEDASKGWSVKRIGRAELAILRVAVYEIKYDSDIPFKVAVNEALELSKKYCEPEAGAFINGILSAFAE